MSSVQKLGTDLTRLPSLGLFELKLSVANGALKASGLWQSPAVIGCAAGLQCSFVSVEGNLMSRCCFS